jgi:hypothetical protein
MRAWPPYAIYETATLVIALGGTPLGTILGTIVVWRGVRRDSIFKVKYIVVGVGLVMIASLALFAWPSFGAERRLEARQTR